MKRIAVLLVVLLTGLALYGCGSTGSNDTTGTTSSPSNNNGPTPTPNGNPSGPVTAFTLNLVDNAALVTRMVNTGTGHAPTNARVVIRRYDNVPSQQTICTASDPDTGDCITLETQTVNHYSEVWKDIQDYAYNGSGSLSVGIPVGVDYTIDVLTALYSSTSGSYDILSYGTTSHLQIVGNGSASIQMIAVPNILNMSIDDPSYTKGKLKIHLNNGSPFNSSYTLNIDYIGIVDLVTNYSVTNTSNIVSTSNTIIDLPTSYTTGTIDVSAQLNINGAFQKFGEAPSLWKRTFPNTLYGEQAYSIFIAFSSISIL